MAPTPGVGSPACVNFARFGLNPVTSRSCGRDACRCGEFRFPRTKYPILARSGRFPPVQARRLPPRISGSCKSTPVSRLGQHPVAGPGPVGMNPTGRARPPRRAIPSAVSLPEGAVVCRRHLAWHRRGGRSHVALAWVEKAFACGQCQGDVGVRSPAGGGLRGGAPRHAEGGLPGAASRLAVGWALLLVLFHCSARVSFGPTFV
jgi:hypothetical protein